MKSQLRFELTTEDGEMTFDLLSSLTEHGTSSLLVMAASSPNTPRAALWQLAKETDAKVRYAVARNEDAGEDILAYLAADEEEAVRNRVAANPSTPLSILETLVSDTDTVQKSIVFNRNVSVDLLIQIAKQTQFTLHNSAIKQLAALLTDQSLAPITLAVMSSIDELKIRVFKHPNLSATTTDYWVNEMANCLDRNCSCAPRLQSLKTGEHLGPQHYEQLAYSHAWADRDHKVLRFLINRATMSDEAYDQLAKRTTVPYALQYHYEGVRYRLRQKLLKEADLDQVDLPQAWIDRLFA